MIAAAGLIGVVVGVALLALLNYYVYGERGQESTEEDWPDREDANDETVGLIYEHTKDSPSDQLRDSEQLDTKTTAVFAAATVAISLAVRLPQSDHRLRFATGLLTDDPRFYYLDAVDVCIYLAAVLWALSALATVLVVLTRSGPNLNPPSITGYRLQTLSMTVVRRERLAHAFVTKRLLTAERARVFFGVFLRLVMQSPPP